MSFSDRGGTQGRVDLGGGYILRCGVVRYVRHLDSTIHAIQIKTKVCQLVEAMMMRRDDLTFRQEMKFRNKLVEYLTDWIMGNSHQLNVQGDVFTMSRYAVCDGLHRYSEYRILQSSKNSNDVRSMYNMSSQCA